MWGSIRQIICFKCIMMKLYKYVTERVCEIKLSAYWRQNFKYFVQCEKGPPHIHEHHNSSCINARFQSNKNTCVVRSVCGYVRYCSLLYIRTYIHQLSINSKWSKCQSRCLFFVTYICVYSYLCCYYYVCTYICYYTMYAFIHLHTKINNTLSLCI